MCLQTEDTTHIPAAGDGSAPKRVVSIAGSKSMSLDSLQKTFESDTHPTVSRKETQILWQAQTASRSRFLPANSLRSRDHSTARSLDTLCDPEYMANDRQRHLAARYRASTVENLPTATQSDNEYLWNAQHQAETFENLAPVGHRPGDKYSSSSRSPLVIEMAREIEHLKAQLAAYQTGQRVLNRDGCYSSEQSGKMVKRGKLAEEKDGLDVFSGHATFPVVPVSVNNERSQSPLFRHDYSVSPSADKRIGRQDLGDSTYRMNGSDGPGMWHEDAGFDQQHQKLDVNELPLVTELRGQVARLQNELKSVRVNAVNRSEDTAFTGSLLEKNSTSGNVSAESIAVTHLRRMIRVRTVELLVYISHIVQWHSKVFQGALVQQ